MDIEAMSTLEKIRAMELLWESLEANHPEDAPPSWHRKVLEDRQRAMQENSSDVISLEEVKQRGAR